MRSDQELQEKAMTLLRTAQISNAPVEVEPLLRCLNVEVRYEEGDDDVSGGLYRLPDGPIIGVNSHHSHPRQRFTIAHEIGHLLLHDLPVFVDESFELPPDGVNSQREQPTFRRDTISSLAIDPVEIEANKFAASLLMPLAFLRVDLAQVPQPLRADSVKELAARYKVSQLAMVLRLTNLGVPVDQA
jgi:Zn-dependent peptidase ImmA (M78 family)